MGNLPELPRIPRDKGHGFKPLIDRSGLNQTTILKPSGLPQQPSDLRDLRSPLSLRLKITRIAMIVGLLSTLLVGFATLLWLVELRLFDISQDTLNTIVAQQPTDNSLVFDRNGEKIGEFFNHYQIYVPFSQLPKPLIDAIIAIEDRNFWHHHGYDVRGIARATLSKVLRSRTSQGGSTLTQQVVRNFVLARERSLSRKLQELAYAIHLEKRLTKEKILEIYTNALFLGNGAYGVGAAAVRYFGRPIEQLASHELALIAGLFQSPSRYNPVKNPEAAKLRQRQVINAMQKTGSITASQARDMAKAPLNYVHYQPINSSIAPYFVDYVHEQSKQILTNLSTRKDAKKRTPTSIDGQGLRIYTTLDTQLQKMAEHALSDADKLLNDAQKKTAQVRSPDGTFKSATVEAAVLSIHPQTGEILAMIGGRNYEKSKFNRTWQAQRSPGSVFKPIVYSLALERNYNWSDVIFVSPVTIDNYRPHTPSEDYLSETTLLRAFYRSMNTPTIELGQKLRLKNVMAHAKKLGIRSPLKEEFGTMLGSSDTSMFDLARVYASFANEGVMVEPVAITKITDRNGQVLWQADSVKQRSQRVMTPQIAYLMTQGMRSVLAMGTAYTSAHLANKAAGKTGTSNDSTDNWFCGYTSDLVSIVWTGTDEHARMHGNITGSKLALPIWDKLMSQHIAAHDPPGFRSPTGVVSDVVHPRFGHRSDDGIRMYFLSGRGPKSDSSPFEALSIGSVSGSYRNVFTE